MREFRDRLGREWRAWEVSPESIHPQTKAEDFLADCYRGGWLVFETVDGVEKRRLCPTPYAWDQRPDAHLLELLARAEILRPRARARPRYSGTPADLPPNVPPDIAADLPRDETGNLDMSQLGVVRTLEYPGGEVWNVCVVFSEEAGSHPVLRFESPSHAIDVVGFPSDWVDFTGEQLVLLMRQGVPVRDRRRKDQPLRRHDDPRPNTG